MGLDLIVDLSAMDGRLALRPENRPCWPAMTRF